jgi:hypothetical protein
MPVTYPPAAPTLSGDTLTINRFLNNPTLVARRLRTLLEQRFIAARLLAGRYNVEGGAIKFETGESIYVIDDPRPVAPGAEYPLTTIPTGAAGVATVVKWGEDSEITDESIKRQGGATVEKSLAKLANSNVRKVDSVALGAIASSVTQSAAAAAAWSTATAVQMLRDVALAKANIVALNQGYEPDTVVLDDIRYAYAFAAFLGAGLMPREAANPLATGVFPEIDGMVWLPTPNLPTAGQVLVADSKSLGGIGREDLGGGYVTVNEVGTEVKSMREDKRDLFRVRARANVVPVVLEPAAAYKITGA